MMAPCLLITVSFAHYTLVQKKPLTAAVAFVSTCLVKLTADVVERVWRYVHADKADAEMQSTLMALPRQVTSLLNQRLALLRIVSFINMDDVDTLETAKCSAELFIRGKIGWTASDESDTSPFTLDLDLSFPKGAITLIAGKFGSGKTLALLALLGEVKVLSGEVGYATSDVSSSHAHVDWSCLEGVAYCPQVAWLQSQSIR
jgi:ABC-type bacteriocin/lantibiotic exporter with double-glycine peptidase domain